MCRVSIELFWALFLGGKFSLTVWKPSIQNFKITTTNSALSAWTFLLGEMFNDKFVRIHRYDCSSETRILSRLILIL